MSDRVSLKVNGKVYGGWKTARISRSIETIAGGFSLSVSERWTNQGEAWPIFEGDDCTLLLNDSPIIFGYIDSRRLNYDSNQHTVSLSGRDNTGDLVDCSALLTTWEFKNVDVLGFAKKICSPFNIDVTLQTGITLTRATKLSISPGDTAFNALEQACRVAGVLPISDGLGGLVLTRAGSSRCGTSLVEGQNILSASAEFSTNSRFHKYVVLGQHAGRDDFNGTAAASVKGSAIDSSVTRTERVLVIRPEHNVTIASATKRAQWEATTRAARSDVVTITVQGWTQADGTLWPVNSLVKVVSPTIAVDGTMLIAQAEYSIDDTSGTTTTLTLKRPDAFKPEPVISKESNLWKEISRGV